MSAAEPYCVKAVRRHCLETLAKQIIASAATYSVVCGLDSDQVHSLPGRIVKQLARYIQDQRERFGEKRTRAAERFHFIDPQKNGSSLPLESSSPGQTRSAVLPEHPFQ